MVAGPRASNRHAEATKMISRKEVLGGWVRQSN